MPGYTKRLGRELSDLKTNPAVVMDDNPLYAGKTFRLQFRFTPTYPIEAPEVQFIASLGRGIPMHPHIYSNGHICLDVLGSGWSPIQTVGSVSMSIQSMLAGNDRNGFPQRTERPPDDARYIASAPISPKQTRFVYHDDNV
ncbi:ubiquitin-conjugating enzyme/RWD-like protein [Lipomyces tetrasporus]|uniref:Ubiquitin-conjugating enzyme/RWD-like protein n=1 Tax=Lipomyces tetrasporus TaxID=54092 RepID=A0AAD7VWM0_9ASCO|nr:ubiquitin-conjugating enzyme/RWD-like protein [Lipomyces tetrasporus]KAJ8104154.1 ubiquitin-conjugating enzyme/RWD-like protein [Lipomyces tetrasporus]